MRQMEATNRLGAVVHRLRMFETLFPTIYKPSRDFRDRIDTIYGSRASGTTRFGRLFRLVRKQSGVANDPLRNFLHRRMIPVAELLIPERFRTESPVSPFPDKLARFIDAAVGGMGLLIPMLIMSLHPSLSKSLITTCIAVLLFSGVICLVSKASNAETLAVTATYAAVLVVFVGTSN